MPWTTGWPVSWPNRLPAESERSGLAGAGADHGVLDERGRELPVTAEDVALPVAPAVPGKGAPLLQQVPLCRWTAFVEGQRVAQHPGGKRPVRLGLPHAGVGAHGGPDEKAVRRV